MVTNDLVIHYVDNRHASCFYNFADEFTNELALFRIETVSRTISFTISFADWSALFTDPPTTPIGLQHR